MDRFQRRPTPTSPPPLTPLITDGELDVKLKSLIKFKKKVLLAFYYQSFSNFMNKVTLTDEFTDIPCPKE